MTLNVKWSKNFSNLIQLSAFKLYPLLPKCTSPTFIPTLSFIMINIDNVLIL